MSLKRSIRRASVRRRGEKLPERNNGQLVPGTVEGRAMGVRVFDYEMWFAHHPRAPLVYADVVMVHFRHPTKKRAPGRVCRGRFVQSHQLQFQNGRILHV